MPNPKVEICYTTKIFKITLKLGQILGEEVRCLNKIRKKNCDFLDRISIKSLNCYCANLYFRYKLEEQ